MATQNSNDSSKIVPTSQPVTNSGSLNGIIRGVNEDYLTKNPNLPEPEEIEHDILGMLRNEIMFHNSMALPGTKYKIPETLPNVSVEEVMQKKYRFVNIFFDGMKESDCGLLAIYMESGERAGTYSYDMDIIRREILRFNNSITKRGMDEVIHLIKLKAPKVYPCSEKNLVPVNNGIFDFDTKTLLPFTPDKIFLSKVRVDYNPFAKNMFIHNNDDGTDWDVESWILDIMDDKPDMAELIWQVIGAIIRPNVKWGCACFMYSETGNNGKGTLCSLMRNLVGEGSYTSITLADFGKDFMLEPLIHSTAVIVDENDVGTYLDKVGNLKAVITGDVVQINRKFKQPISFKFNGFMVQCLNELPRVKDKSDSFYRRQLFIPFTKCFTGAERKYIKQDYLKRKEVLEYVLYRVLHMDYEEFTVPEECKNALEEYKEFNDPVRQFMDEIMEQLQWDLVPFTFLYDLYKSWHAKSYPSGSIQGKNTFINDVLNLIRESDTWYCNNKSTKIRPEHRMDKPEPLIWDYKLEDWYNPNYKGSDVNKLCMPALKANYTGILRK